MKRNSLAGTKKNVWNHLHSKEQIGNFSLVCLVDSERRHGRELAHHTRSNETLLRSLAEDLSWLSSIGIIAALVRCFTKQVVVLFRMSLAGAQTTF